MSIHGLLSIMLKDLSRFHLQSLIKSWATENTKYTGHQFCSIVHPNFGLWKSADTSELELEILWISTVARMDGLRNKNLN